MRRHTDNKYICGPQLNNNETSHAHTHIRDKIFLPEMEKRWTTAETQREEKRKEDKRKWDC